MSGWDQFFAIRFNERVRFYIGMASNLAIGLIAAAAYRIVMERHTHGWAVTWTLVAAVLIFASHAALGMLEPEG